MKNASLLALKPAVRYSCVYAYISTSTLSPDFNSTVQCVSQIITISSTFWKKCQNTLMTLIDLLYKICFHGQINFLRSAIQSDKKVQGGHATAPLVNNRLVIYQIQEFRGSMPTIEEMYFPSLKLFEVLKFIQFLMLFENQNFHTSSNFGAPQ